MRLTNACCTFVPWSNRNIDIIFFSITQKQIISKCKVNYIFFLTWIHYTHTSRNKKKTQKNNIIIIRRNITKLMLPIINKTHTVNFNRIQMPYETNSSFILLLLFCLCCCCCLNLMMSACKIYRNKRYHIILRTELNSCWYIRLEFRLNYAGEYGVSVYTYTFIVNGMYVKALNVQHHTQAIRIEHHNTRQR